MHSPDRKPTALGYALLTYMTLVIATITLIPFEFKTPVRIHINLHGTVADVLANIVLLIPLLWLGGLSMGGELDRLGLTTVLGLFGGSVIASVYVNRTGARPEAGRPHAGRLCGRLVYDRDPAGSCGLSGRGGGGCRCCRRGRRAFGPVVEAGG